MQTKENGTTKEIVYEGEGVWLNTETQKLEPVHVKIYKSKTPHGFTQYDVNDYAVDAFNHWSGKMSFMTTNGIYSVPEESVKHLLPF